MVCLYLGFGSTDLRKSIDWLAALVKGFELSTLRVKRASVALRIRVVQ
jgi:hypothetical protein